MSLRTRFSKARSAPLPVIRPKVFSVLLIWVERSIRHTHELGTSADEVTHGMRGKALDPRFPVPAHAHELGEGFSIASVGVVPLQSCCAIQADYRKPKQFE